MDSLIQRFLFRLAARVILVSFLISSLMPANTFAQVLDLPVPGTMVSSSAPFMPVLMKGLKVHPENPLLFDFILDAGQSGLPLDGVAFKAESQKLIKYFLASLTIKEADQWVNLSPYEKDRIITDELGQTTLGRDMLAQDYILKQLTASMLYPEKDLGKAFWDRVYAKARERFGSTDIPMDTFHKVWIVADKAKVFEQANAAYVVGAHLKVMLDIDHMALGQAATEQPAVGEDKISADDLAQQAAREILIPEIEKEVNQGQNFAPLRQMFYSMILASWYKSALKESLINQVYSNRGKTSGVLSGDPTVTNKIYQQYLAACRKGVFNYIKDDLDTATQISLPRKYFSGGLKLLENTPQIEKQIAQLDQADRAMLVAQGDGLAQVSVQVKGSTGRAAMTFQDSSQAAYYQMSENMRIRLDQLIASEQTGFNLEQKGADEQILRFNNGLTVTLILLRRYELEQTLAVVSLNGNNKNENQYVSLAGDRLQNGSDIARKALLADIAKHQQKNIEQPSGAGSLLTMLTYDQDRDITLIHIIGFKRAFSVKRFLQAKGLVKSVIGNQALTAVPGNRLDIFDHPRSDESHQAEDNAVADHAQVDSAAKNINGGIDLNANNMGLEVSGDGQGINIKFDPAMIAGFRSGNFTGVEGVILRIVPIQSLLPGIINITPVESPLVILGVK